MSQSVWVEQPVTDQMKRTYYYEDGTYLTKENGTVAWRNNNEGNLRPGSLSANRIGVDKKNFAIFATPEEGHDAKKYLLFSSSSYKDLSLKDAIARYAPASDNNDPVAYANFIMSNGNVENKVMNKYTADEQDRIMSAMKINEGYKVGSETRGYTSDKVNKPEEQKSDNTSQQQKLDYNQKSAVKYNKKLGYSKSYWKSVQEKLNTEISANLVPDGIPGGLTADAIYNFQVARNMALKDGKFGNKTSTELGMNTSTANNTVATQSNQDKQDSNNQNTSNITIPDAATIMSTSYTPDLDLLNKHAIQKGIDVKDVGTSANYVAKWCVGDNSQHQCTRGTSLFLQLASYARGEANSTYKSSCAAHLFGSANALTNYNISSSVANEYTMKSAENKTGKSNMNTYIADNLTKDGEFVTFQYSTSQHIVFHSGGKWYSDFKQGTAAGCGGKNTTYSNVHFFNR
jgi:hypothetical protein